MGFLEVIKDLAGRRRHEFDLERAVYLTVLHRLFAAGSDRAAEVWKENYGIPGAENLALHQLYRTMGWLGEQIGPGVLGAPRCTKDLIEEAIFDRGRDLFSQVGLVFFDTTSIYCKRHAEHPLRGRNIFVIAEGYDNSDQGCDGLEERLEKSGADTSGTPGGAA